MRIHYHKIAPVRVLYRKCCSLGAIVLVDGRSFSQHRKSRAYTDPTGVQPEDETRIRRRPVGCDYSIGQKELIS